MERFRRKIEEVTMTSLELARVIDKPHEAVLAEARQLFKDLESCSEYYADMLYLKPYTDKDGQKHFVYWLSRQQILMLSTIFQDRDIAYKILDRLDEIDVQIARAIYMDEKKYMKTI